MESHTWDGLPISPVPPFGAAIIVYREVVSGALEFLVLHRRAVLDDDADWAWGPPSGARWPGENISVTARRELREETGIDRSPVQVSRPDIDWLVFALEMKSDTEIILSAEHDRLSWLPAAQALKRISPAAVRHQLRDVITWIAAR